MARILLIEDDETLRTAYGIALEQAGHQVVQAADGLEGWRVIHEDPPELVLLDILLPQLNGHEFLQALGRLDRPKPKVIVISNLTAPEDIDLAMQLGAVKYLVKSRLDMKGFLAEVSRIAAEV